LIVPQSEKLRKGVIASGAPFDYSPERGVHRSNPEWREDVHWFIF
jgi:hypothetical protein